MIHATIKANLSSSNKNLAMLDYMVNDLKHSLKLYGSGFNEQDLSSL